MKKTSYSSFGEQASLIAELDRALKCEVLDTLQTVNAMLDELLLSNKQRSFVDFEDHMNTGVRDNGASLDFRNPEITEFIAKH